MCFSSNECRGSKCAKFSKDSSITSASKSDTEAPGGKGIHWNKLVFWITILWWTSTPGCMFPTFTHDHDHVQPSLGIVLNSIDWLSLRVLSLSARLSVCECISYDPVWVFSVKARVHEGGEKKHYSASLSHHLPLGLQSKAPHRRCCTTPQRFVRLSEETLHETHA